MKGGDKDPHDCSRRYRYRYHRSWSVSSGDEATTLIILRSVTTYEITENVHEGVLFQEAVALEIHPRIHTHKKLIRPQS